MDASAAIFPTTSPDHFRTMAENAPAMLWIGDETGKCVHLNRAMRRFWGLSEADIATFDWNSSLHPDDRGILAGPFTHAMSTQTPLEVEARYRRADGEYRILHTFAEPRFDPDGSFSGMVGINTDVTDQRAAERMLGIQALLLEHMTEGVSLSDETGMIVYTNCAEDRLFGYGPGELVGQHVSVQNAYEPEENQRRFSEVIATLGAEGRWSGEWRNRRKDRSEFVSASNINTVEVDGRPHYLCVQRDVSEERRQEREQRATAVKLDLAMAAAGLGHFALDIESDVATLSPRAAEIFGLGSQTAAPWDGIRVRVHRDDRAALDAAIAQVLHTAEPFDHACRVVGDSGEDIRWIVLRGATEFDCAGQPIGVTGVVRDETADRTAREREHLLAREVDHRAKNALAVVQSILRLTPFTNRDAFVGTITGRIEAMARVHTLLSQNAWKGATIEQVLRAEFAPFEAEGRFRVEGPDVNLRLEAAQPLTLLVHELATNATKYGSLSAPAGRLDVTWRMADDGDVVLEWVERGGPPIAEPQAMGFGTKLIRGCASQLGGSIHKTWEREGLRCHVRIGALQLHPGVGASPIPVRNGPRATRLDGSRVLIVEDEVLLAMEIAGHLRAAGATVVGPAHTLKAGLAFAAAEDFDIAVLDLNLGGISAEPLFQVLRNADVPLVVVTGYEGVELEAPVLHKPVDHDVLLATLSRCLTAQAVTSRDKGGVLRRVRV
ncbi:MAG TPA: PAS domain S-box protein [Methylomirabilota bacterium]|nr:PAS domain S-box protein [Methylomirabilota bacterium]